MKNKDGKYGDQTDEELTDIYRQTGNKEYIGELYRRYGALVFGVCLKYLKNKDQAQDMVMSIFEKLIGLLREKEVQNFRSWLHVVSRNECLMLLRKQGKIYENSLDDSPELSASDNGIEEKKLKELKLNQLTEAIEELKEEQRICIDLFYLKEKCYQEIAESTGFSLKQVKSYIQNGKRNLKLILSSRPEFANQNPNHE